MEWFSVPVTVQAIIAGGVMLLMLSFWVMPLKRRRRAPLSMVPTFRFGLIDLERNRLESDGQHLTISNLPSGGYTHLIMPDDVAEQVKHARIQLVREINVRLDPDHSADFLDGWSAWRFDPILRHNVVGTEPVVFKCTYGGEELEFQFVFTV